jgi:hypothetical protein
MTETVPVRIVREGVWVCVDFDTLTDDELAAFAASRNDPLEGWRWARTLAQHLAHPPTHSTTP